MTMIGVVSIALLAAASYAYETTIMPTTAQKIEIVPAGSDFRYDCPQSGAGTSVRWNHSLGESDTGYQVNRTSPDGTSLTIGNVTVADAGFYTCCIDKTDAPCSNLILIVLSVDKNRAIKPSRTSTSSGDLILNPSGPEPVVDFTITIQFPVMTHRLQLELKQENSSKEKQLLGKKIRNSVAYVVTQATLSQSGLFTVRASHGADSKRYSLHILISGAPTARMNEYLVKRNGSDLDVVCSGAAYPAVTNVSLSFVPCPLLDWNDCRAAASSSSIALAVTKTEPSDAVQFEARSMVTVEVPGIVHCTASNSNGTTSTTSILQVWHIDEPMMFQQMHPNTVIYTGDIVKLVCTAVVYNTTGDIEFLNGRKNSSGIGHSVTNYTIQRNYIIYSATETETVTCRVPLTNGSYHEKHLTITVVEPVKPHLTSGVKGTTLIKLNDSFSGTVNLECDVAAKPEPSIGWFKDGQLILHRGAILSQVVSADAYVSLVHCIGYNRKGATNRTWQFVGKSFGNLDAIQFSPYPLLVLLSVVILIVVVLAFVIQRLVGKLRQALFRAAATGADHPIVPAEYEFAKKKLKFGKRIGQGEFGVVMLAKAKDIMVCEPWTTVAVKMIKKSKHDETVLNMLISELKTMVTVGLHLNVVNLLGAVTKNIHKHELMLIFEYCQHGSLLDFMRKNRTRFVDCLDELAQAWKTTVDRGSKCSQLARKDPLGEFNTTDLICWAAQVAHGMSYLASKRVLHGDLAARNVLLCDENVVKIGDFGLARTLQTGAGHYTKAHDEPLPSKWLAVECITERVFSSKSDVWAYGVLLWELFSLGTEPYPGKEPDRELAQLIVDGYRMDRPTHASPELHNIMIVCWYVNPNMRPTFEDLAVRFNAMLPMELQNHYLSMNNPYLAANMKTMNYVTSLEAAPPHQPEWMQDIPERGCTLPKERQIPETMTTFQPMCETRPNVRQNVAPRQTGGERIDIKVV